jgi:putative DNA primase/helicase
MHDYAVASPIETFTATNYDKHPTELARLHGARLVTASEPEKGKLWNESRIKLLTGGDRVSARFMQQNFFEFDPQFKLVISGNHRPSFRVVNEAIRRRLHLVPFAANFRDPDRQLPAKLKEEGSGILSWMIEGCLEWQRVELAPPTVVREATEGYLETEDTFGQWLETCCHRNVGGWTSTSVLHASWAEFAKARGEEPGTQKAFAEQMQQRGFDLNRKNVARGFTGVDLKHAEVSGG